VTYQFRILTTKGSASLRSQVAEAIAATGSWRAYLDVRTGAGPVVQVHRLDPSSDTYAVTVTWGSAQKARTLVHELDAALDAADRLAKALVDIRDTSRVADH
jgi:hypothetical protein